MSDDKVFKDGDIVWVKLGNNWWPAEVTGAHRQPDGLTKHLKRKPYCVVKFFQEDSFEYVKNGKQILHFQCNKKEEFIKKGYALHEAKNKFMEKFPSDVAIAERRTSTLIINDRPDSIVKAILGQTFKNSKVDYNDQNKSDDNRSSRRSGDSVTKIINLTPNRTNTRVPGGALTTTSTLFTGPTPSCFSIMSSKATDINKSNTPQSGSENSSVYRCNLCDFTSVRQNVIIFHRKTHSRDNTPTPSVATTPKTFISVAKSPVTATAIATATATATATSKLNNQQSSVVQKLSSSSKSNATTRKKIVETKTNTAPAPAPLLPSDDETDVTPICYPNTLKTQRSSASSARSQTSTPRPTKKKALLTLDRSRRSLRSSPLGLANVIDVTLPKRRVTNSSTEAVIETDDEVSELSSFKSPMTENTTTSNSTVTPISVKRSSEEIRQRLLADWSDEEKDEEINTSLDVVEKSTTIVETKNDDILTKLNDLDVSSAPVVSSVDVSDNTKPNTSHNRIRNIPKKDRRDVVLKEFSEPTISYSPFSTSRTPPVGNTDSNSNSCSSDSVVVVNDIAAPNAEERTDVAQLTLDAEQESTGDSIKEMNISKVTTSISTTNISTEDIEQTNDNNEPLHTTDTICDESNSNNMGAPLMTLSCFDFKEEENDNDMLTSIANFKKKYLSPDKNQVGCGSGAAESDSAKSDLLNKSTEAKDELEQKDKQLCAEIESLLEQTTTSLTEVKTFETSTNTKDNASVKGLPIKERGKRIFKSRNRSMTTANSNSNEFEKDSVDTENALIFKEIVKVSEVDNIDKNEEEIATIIETDSQETQLENINKELKQDEEDVLERESDDNLRSRDDLGKEKTVEETLFVENSSVDNSNTSSEEVKNLEKEIVKDLEEKENSENKNETMLTNRSNSSLSFYESKSVGVSDTKADFELPTSVIEDESVSSQNSLMNENIKENEIKIEEKRMPINKRNKIKSLTLSNINNEEEKEMEAEEEKEKEEDQQKENEGDKINGRKVSSDMLTILEADKQTNLEEYFDIQDENEENCSQIKNEVKLDASSRDCNTFEKEENSTCEEYKSVEEQLSDNILEEDEDEIESPPHEALSGNELGAELEKVRKSKYIKTRKKNNDSPSPNNVQHFTTNMENKATTIENNKVAQRGVEKTETIECSLTKKKSERFVKRSIRGRIIEKNKLKAKPSEKKFKLNTIPTSDVPTTVDTLSKSNANSTCRENTEKSIFELVPNGAEKLESSTITNTKEDIDDVEDKHIATDCTPLPKRGNLSGRTRSIKRHAEVAESETKSVRKLRSKLKTKTRKLDKLKADEFDLIDDVNETLSKSKEENKCVDGATDDGEVVGVKKLVKKNEEERESNADEKEVQSVPDELMATGSNVENLECEERNNIKDSNIVVLLSNREEESNIKAAKDINNMPVILEDITIQKPHHLELFSTAAIASTSSQYITEPQSFRVSYNDKTAEYKSLSSEEEKEKNEKVRIDVDVSNPLSSQIANILSSNNTNSNQQLRTPALSTKNHTPKTLTTKLRNSFEDEIASFIIERPTNTTPTDAFEKDTVMHVQNMCPQLKITRKEKFLIEPTTHNQSSNIDTNIFDINNMPILLSNEHIIQSGENTSLMLGPTTNKSISTLSRSAAIKSVTESLPETPRIIKQQILQPARTSFFTQRKPSTNSQQMLTPHQKQIQEQQQLYQQQKLSLQQQQPVNKQIGLDARGNKYIIVKASTDTSICISPTSTVTSSPQNTQNTKPKSPAAAVTGGRKQAGNTISLPTNAAVKQQQQKLTEELDAAMDIESSMHLTTEPITKSNRLQQRTAGVANSRRRAQQKSSDIIEFSLEHEEIGVSSAKVPKSSLTDAITGDDFSLAQQQFNQLQQQKRLKSQESSKPVHHLHNRKPKKQPQQHRSLQKKRETIILVEESEQQQTEEEENIFTAVEHHTQNQPGGHQSVHSTTYNEEQLNALQTDDPIDSTSKILAVPTQPIPGYNETFLLCTLVNNNYKPIDNVPLYLDHDLNQLVPVPMDALDGQPNLIVNHPPIEDQVTPMQVPGEESVLTTSALKTEEADSSTQLICLQSASDVVENPTTVVLQSPIVEEASNGNDSASTSQLSVFAPTDGASEVISDNAVILNIEGQQIILDAPTFAHLLANPDANTQLVTDDGTEFVLTREVLAALEAQQAEQQIQQLQIAAATGRQISSDGGPTDILAVALAGSDLYNSDVLEIETSQGLQLMGTDGSIVFQSQVLPQAHLTPPITAHTSETNALLNQTPIMSTLEKPSTALSKGKHKDLARAMGSSSAAAALLATSISSDLPECRPNLEDSLAVIGVTSQSSAIPSSLGLPITVTDPKIASKVTMQNPAADIVQFSPHCSESILNNETRMYNDSNS